ncbi:tRNA pseudouridine(13) synthase TruD [Methylococcus sp. EFPC2]|uniref:tRNA pseudouridine(13) synthase TruD n=1 Tax=Methylococcus sp. EFPC2 TaxID=2812648 RepID=UPI001967DB79|nr:tRNA pseudouridine(13) synthase TruD [Methylococcus sp. EFPC2]QSA95868.1 tRNA pseudouridine(13) synthase TruD [Methylococcus sp. EFPC2]
MSDWRFDWPYAYGGPAARGVIKQVPEDFFVDEILGFEPCGEGEHVFLKIEKRGENTDYLARQLAKYAGLPARDVSYAGLKDRHSRTVQWFSAHIPGKREVDWTGFNSDTVSVLAAVRHNRKLKKGALKGNRFEITVRELAGDTDLLEERLARIKDCGLPNYFGPQRFGHEGRNIEKATALFAGELKLRDRQLEGIYLSAARSYLFNAVLARRVDEGTWNRAISGDVFMFSDSHSFFKDEVTAEIVARVESLALHPSGPLAGRGESPADADALTIEQAVAERYRSLSEGLARIGMEVSRRPLRLTVDDFEWALLPENALRVAFILPAGAYATAVLREAIDFGPALD